MSVQAQARAKRRKIVNGYAHMGGSMRRPTISGRKFRSVTDAIQLARREAVREQARKKTKNK